MRRQEVNVNYACVTTAAGSTGSQLLDLCQNGASHFQPRKVQYVKFVKRYILFHHFFIIIL